jgi:hypothetical protein
MLLVEVILMLLAHLVMRFVIRILLVHRKIHKKNLKEHKITVQLEALATSLLKVPAILNWD